MDPQPPARVAEDSASAGSDHVTLFLCGDVMTGRGVDQILPHPGGSHIDEPYVRDAREYVALAESRNGPIVTPVTPAYIWGDALSELSRLRPDVRIINLETSITTSDDQWPGKDIHYRMHPENIACLTAAGVDVCGLANNHVMDYGRAGLVDTLDTLARSGLKAAGAGRTLAEAQAPALVTLGSGAGVAVFAFGAESSGVPAGWAARENRSGIDLPADLSEATAAAILRRVGRVKVPRRVVVCSIHWGSNWGYDVPPEHVRFAHRLIDGGVDIVCGHSSHHPRPIEVYHNRLILYGCGDFIDDYEGIQGHEQYRDDLVLMYFATVAADTGDVIGVQLSPMRIKRLKLTRPVDADVVWLRDTLERVSAPYGAHVDLAANAQLTLRWA